MHRGCARVFGASLQPSAWLSPAKSHSADFSEVAVAAETVLEPGGAVDTVDDQRLAAVVPFLNERIAHREAVALDRRPAIGAHASLREAGDLLCQLLRLLPSASDRRDIFAQADAEAFVGRDFAAGENDLECAALADNARQPHGAAVDQRHAPAAAIHAEIGILRHDAEIAPESELHAAGNGR